MTDKDLTEEELRIQHEKDEYEAECAAAQSLAQAEAEARWEEQHYEDECRHEDYADGHEDDEEP